MIGDWQITDIDDYGFGNFNNLPFQEHETFSLAEEGRLIHKSASKTYEGSWDVRKEQRDEKKYNHYTSPPLILPPRM